MKRPVKRESVCTNECEETPRKIQRIMKTGPIAGMDLSASCMDVCRICWSISRCITSPILAKGASYTPNTCLILHIYLYSYMEIKLYAVCFRGANYDHTPANTVIDLNIVTHHTF